MSGAEVRLVRAASPLQIDPSQIRKGRSNA
jgi:hypothetical protein